MKFSVVAPRTLAVVVIISTLSVVFYSAKWFVADIKSYSVKYAIDDWQKLKTVPELSEIEEAKDQADLAISWMPESAEYHELRARVLLYAASHPNSKDSESLLRDALTDHDMAIFLRPNWPYSWANKALIKAYLNEFDSEYEQAIHQAEILGPWESSVNLVVVEAGLLNWSDLSNKLRTSIIHAAERAAQHRWRDLRGLLNRHNKLFPVCSHMRRSDQQKKVCKL